MSAQLHCVPCHCTFPQSEAHFRTERVESEVWGRVATTFTQISLCPRCGSERLEEVHLCARCHQNAPLEGSDYCSACEDAIDAAYERQVAERQRRLRYIVEAHEFIADLARQQS